MIGTQLGSWIIDKEIGRGGMGRVFLAHRLPTDGELPRQSAIKVLAAELAAESGFQARFQREIDILRQLNHPNIVRFFESGQRDGLSWFVMEHIDGPSFEALLHQQGRLPWPEVLEAAWQIAPALKHAHDRGIIHRDLKPSNLLRAPAMGESAANWGVVKLTDFGIASLFASPHLTVTGGVVGTAEYLSPEQAAGKPVTRRSDLYSLGVVLYTLLTGRTPFVGEPLDLLHKHRFAQFDRPSRLVPEIPHEMDDIICQLMEKDPDKRPGDTMVLFRRLDSLKRKRAYQASQSDSAELDPAGTTVAHTPSEVRYKVEGPATLMSRLMRWELERERLGGPMRQFLHRPLVLVALLALCVGLLVWSFWPPSAETLYQRGAALMRSENPDDWEMAWDKYFGPLLEKYPDTPHRSELELWRQKSEAAQAARQARREAQRAGPMSEAQWFYQEGLRLRQRGDEAGAKRVWQALVAAFGDVPTEEPWVRLAEEHSAESPEKVAAKRQWEPVRQAVRRARQLRDQGQFKEAEAIEKALKELYREDQSAAAILRGE